MVYALNLAIDLKAPVTRQDQVHLAVRHSSCVFWSNWPRVRNALTHVWRDVGRTV